MKKLAYLLSLSILASLLILPGCKKDDGGGLTDEQKQEQALNGTWTATDVNDGSTDRGDDYSDFTLTINGTAKTYATSGGPDLLPFPISGSWAFGTQVKTQITLDPGSENIQATYAIASDGSVLTINFTYSGEGFLNAKVEVVEGSWSFEFTK